MKNLERQSGLKLKKKPNLITEQRNNPKVTGHEILQHALASLVESANDAIFSKDLNGTLLTWNKGAERIYGYTKDEIIGKSVSILVPSDRENDVAEIIGKIKYGENIDRYETVRKRKDGTLIDISLSVSPVIDKKGRIIAASIVAHDITEEKRSREIRSFLASIVESSDDAIFSKNLDGLILSWNKSAETLYGYSAAEVIGKHVSLLMSVNRKSEVDRIIEAIIDGKRIEHYETIRVTKDGKEVNVSLTASPVLDSNGKLIAISVIARDITVRIKAEEERARLVKELARTVQEKNVLLQEVYHRVKNNLQVVGSLLDLRSRYLDPDPKKLRAAFSESVSRIRAMAMIHESLYKTEKLDKVDFLIYLRTLSKQLLSSYAPEKVSINITGSNQSYSLDMAVSLGLIFNELITNSLKYAFNNVNDGVIEIDFFTKNQKRVIRIADNGIGLPPGFDLTNANSFGFKIVKLLAKQINAIIVHLKESKGTAFELKLMLATGEENGF